MPTGATPPTRGERSTTNSLAQDESSWRRKPPTGRVAPPPWRASSRPRGRDVAVWRHLARGLRALLNRPAADRDIADEVEHYFSEAAADLEARGLSSEEARRLARLELGSAAAVR